MKIVKFDHGNFGGYWAWYYVEPDTGRYWGLECGKPVRTRCTTAKGFTKWVAYDGRAKGGAA